MHICHAAPSVIQSLRNQRDHCLSERKEEGLDMYQDPSGQTPNGGYSQGYPGYGAGGGNGFQSGGQNAFGQNYPEQAYSRDAMQSGYDSNAGAMSGYPSGKGVDYSGGYGPAPYTTGTPTPNAFPQAYQAAAPYIQNDYPQYRDGAVQDPYSQPAAGGYYPQGKLYQEMPGGYQGYSSSSAGYPPQSAPQPAGSFIPQTPYSPGYSSPGYQPPALNSAPQSSYQGYSAYQQMGYQGSSQASQSSVQQMPMNGGGYVPQPVPVRKQPFIMKDSYLLILSAVLLILFAAGLFIPGIALKILFAVSALLCIAVLWIRPLIAQNKRLCFSIVFGALAIVTAIVAATSGKGSSTADATGTGANNPSPTQVLSSGVVVDGQGSGNFSVTAYPETPTPGPENEDQLLTDRLITFFRYWGANQLDDMLTLCDPTWRSSVENPKTELFSLQSNRIPLEVDTPFENITGTNDDDNRTVTLTTLINRNNGKDPVRYRMNITMVKNREDGLWYVDPKSLRSYDTAETPDPAEEATPAPTEAPTVDGNTMLYYNPDGGSKYHLDPNCKSIHAKYLPLKGKFPYSKVNDEQYAKLSPCNVCAAPLRNQ